MCVREKVKSQRRRQEGTFQAEYTKLWTAH